MSRPRIENPAPPRAPRRPRRSAAEQGFEKITEAARASAAHAAGAAENIAHVAKVDARFLLPPGRWSELLACLPVGAERIVALAFFRIGKNFVSFVESL